MQRGNEAEENAGRDGEQEREGEHAPVGAQIEEEGDLDRQAHAAHGVIDERGETDAGRAARERDEQALSNQLPNKTSPAGADREPDRDLLPPLGGAREEEIGEIHAGEEQNQSTDRKQDSREAEDGVADLGQEQARLHEEEPAPGVLRIILRELRGQRFQFGLGLRGGHAGFEPADARTCCRSCGARGIARRARCRPPSGSG